MPKASTRKLKVFQTRIGFYDVVVAVPSKAAALRAWGTHADLFEQGLAAPATEPKAIEAALAQPETLLRRPAGSDGDFAIEPARPKLPPGERPALRERPRKQIASPKPKPAAPPKPAPPPKPKPDRGKLTAAEAALAALDREEEARKQAFDQRLRDIDAAEAELRARRLGMFDEKRAADRAFREERSAAERTLEAERRAYRRAGGED